MGEFERHGRVIIAMMTCWQIFNRRIYWTFGEAHRFETVSSSPVLRLLSQN